ncbi:MAG: SagB/ThcOx family dehydrogenase [Actinobacteria bacterium]|nr:MAG: SagB/ThcOx family dehydrogenase [Actinomycetota bacterium]
MIVRVSECGSLSWRSGTLVWDDPLHHRQLALTDLSLEIVRWFADWRALDGVVELSERHLAVARRLLEEGVLVAQGSEEHGREEAVVSEWAEWGAATRQYHYASRTTPDTQFATTVDGLLDQSARALEVEPPAIASERGGLRLGLPGVDADDAAWRHPGLVAALRARRSVRRFTGEPLALRDLAAVMHLAAGLFGVFDELGTGPEAYMTSPAAGALHPTELYVRARRVSGLEPATYHYAATTGELELLDDVGPDIDSPHAYGGQDWLADSPATLIHTAVPARSQWRYAMPRGYRDVVLGLGHVSQTILLLATARGLGATFATAVRDDVLEEHLGCDGISEIVLGVHALGHPAPEERPAPVTPEWLS